MKYSMKKISSVLLSLMLVMAVGISAFAAPASTGTAQTQTQKTQTQKTQTHKTVSKNFTATVPVVKAELLDQTSVKVSWNTVKGADGYRVYLLSNGKWKIQGTYKSTTRWVRYRGLTAGTKYTYTVRAFANTDNGKVWTSYNKKGVSVTTKKTETKPDTPKPEVTSLTAPTVKAVAVSWECAKVSWTTVKNAAGYCVYTYTADGWKLQGTYKSTTRWVKIHNLKPGVTNTYKVRAFANGKSGKIWGSYSKTAKVVTRLDAPKLGKAVSAKNGIAVSWSSTAGAQGYRVYRKTADGSWKKLATVKGQTKVSYTDTKASKGVTYYYTVRAYRAVDDQVVLSGYDTAGLKAVRK